MPETGLWCTRPAGSSAAARILHDGAPSHRSFCSIAGAVSEPAPVVCGESACLWCALSSSAPVRTAAAVSPIHGVPRASARSPPRCDPLSESLLTQESTGPIHTRAEQRRLLQHSNSRATGVEWGLWPCRELVHLDRPAGPIDDGVRRSTAVIARARERRRRRRMVRQLKKHRAHLRQRIGQSICFTCAAVRPPVVPHSSTDVITPSSHQIGCEQKGGSKREKRNPHPFIHTMRKQRPTMPAGPPAHRPSGVLHLLFGATTKR
jgi:hypothetical protein